MKKLGLMLLVAIMSISMCLTMVACGESEKEILVVCREAASGTREAFDKYVGLEASNITSSAEEYSSTGNVRVKVASTKSAIGYISIASVDDSVKTLKIEGVEANSDNVRSGDYKIQRPFLLLTSTSVTLNESTQDFFNFCMSKDAQSSITAEKGITTADFDTRSTYASPVAALSGTIVLKGSTSMEEMIKKLVADYLTFGGSLVSGITFTYDFPGSGGGRTAVKEDTAGNVIGLASSQKTDAGYTEHTLCLDAVAVIVNKKNTLITDINATQLKDIYSGTVVKFSALA